MDKLNRIMGSIKKKEKKMCVSIIDCIKHGRGLHDVNHRFWKSICKECGGLPDLSSHHLFTLKSVSFALCFILFLSIHQLFHFHQTSNVCDVSTFFIFNFHSGVFNAGNENVQANLSNL